MSLAGTGSCPWSRGGGENASNRSILAVWPRKHQRGDGPTARRCSASTVVDYAFPRDSLVRTLRVHMCAVHRPAKRSVPFTNRVGVLASALYAMLDPALASADFGPICQYQGEAIRGKHHLRLPGRDRTLLWNEIDRPLVDTSRALTSI